VEFSWDHDWWLIFPIGAFLFGAWDRWLSYRRSRDRLEMIKIFAAQGKDVPPELLRELSDEAPPADLDWSNRHARRAYWRQYARRNAPYWRWRSAIVTGAVAGAFWIASQYSGIPAAEPPFRLVAIILTCVAAANLLLAVLSGGDREK